MPKLNWKDPLSYKFTLTSLVIVILFAALIQSQIFILPLITTYYLYIGFTAIFLIATGVILFKQKIPADFNLPAPVIFFILWGLYMMMHGQFISNGFNQRHIFLLTSCSLFTALFLVFYLKLINLKAVFATIGLMAVFEVVDCMLQFFGVIHSNNEFFNVTGSWENPNVTAMFLALAVPAILPFLTGKNLIVKKISIAVLLSIAIALLMLKCRTAYFGMGIGAVILINFRFNIMAKIKDKSYRGTVVVAAVLITFVMIFLGDYLYQAKKNSADGRKLVWKLSANMLVDKPLTGYGYGLFERSYNLYQANYINEGNATNEELEKAGFVRTGYNEYLENAVEGGIFGLFFFTGLMASLLYIPHKLKSIIKEDNFIQAAYIGIAMFAGMSLINFSVSSIVLLLIFILYSSIWCASLANTATGFKWAKILSNYLKPILPAILILAALAIFLSQNSLPFASYKNNVAIKLGQQKQYDKAINIFTSINSNIPDYDDYLKNYGMALFSQGNFKEAIKCFNRAKLYTSDFNLYLLTGECYFKAAQYPNSEKEFGTAAALQPQILLPRVALMNIYYKTNDTAKSAAMAYNILQFKPKVISLKTNKYKLSAKNLLIKLKRPIQILQPIIDFKKTANYPAIN